MRDFRHTSSFSNVNSMMSKFSNKFSEFTSYLKTNFLSTLHSPLSTL